MSTTTTIQEQRPSEVNSRRVRISKVVINIGVGRSGEAIERARRVIEDIVHQKASSTQAKKSIRDFGVHKGEPIGMMVTVRGKKAPEVLSAEISEAAFDAVVEELLRESPSLRDGPHFYRKCREYHLKTHPHYQLASSRHKKNY